MAGKIRALVGCQVEACAEEVSYPLDMLRKLNGQPICQSCYESGDFLDSDNIAWHDLPQIDLSDLCE